MRHWGYNPTCRDCNLVYNWWQGIHGISESISAILVLHVLSPFQPAAGCKGASEQQRLPSGTCLLKLYGIRPM